MFLANRGTGFNRSSPSNNNPSQDVDLYIEIRTALAPLSSFRRALRCHSERRILKCHSEAEGRRIFFHSVGEILVYCTLYLNTRIADLTKTEYTSPGRAGVAYKRFWGATLPLSEDSHPPAQETRLGTLGLAIGHGP